MVTVKELLKDVFGTESYAFRSAEDGKKYINNSDHISYQEEQTSSCAIMLVVNPLDDVPQRTT